MQLSLLLVQRKKNSQKEMQNVLSEGKNITINFNVGANVCDERNENIEENHDCQRNERSRSGQEPI